MSESVKYKVHISSSGGRWGWKVYRSPFDPKMLPMASFKFGAHNRGAARKEAVKWILGSGLQRSDFGFMREEEEDLYPSIYISPYGE